MNEDEDEFANPEEEGGCEDGTSTGTRKEGNQPDSTNPPFFRLALSEHLSSLQQGSSSQTTRDTINTLLDLLQQANSSDKSCVDIFFNQPSTNTKIPNIAMIQCISRSVYSAS